MNISHDRHDHSKSPAVSALERLPHLSNRICQLWGQREFETCVNRLLMDSRDGKRQGLPWDAAQELLFLVELCVAKRAVAASAATGLPFGQMYTLCLSKAQDFAPSLSGGPDPWSDPLAIKDVGRQRHSESRPSGKNRGMLEKQSWWSRLMG